MSCPIVTSLSKGCRDARGGIEIIYVTEWANISQTTITEASGVITNSGSSFLTTGKKFWTIQVEQFTANDVWNINSNRATGTTSYDPNLNIYIPKRQASVNQFVKTLALNDLAFIVKDNNGTYWLLGRAKGMAMVPSTAPSATQMSGEQTGYVLAFNGMEADFPLEVPSALITYLLSPAS